MKGPLKWLAAVVGVIVVLFIAAAILIPLLIDPNDYKQELVAQVKDHTGRDLLIDGDIELTVFPWIGIKFGKVVLSNAAGFDNPVFAGTDKVSIRIKLLPLLSKRLEMDTVTVHGLTLNLARDANGHNNWDDLAKAGGGGTESSGSTSTGSGGGSEGGAAVALAIGGLDIDDANLSWIDARQNQRFEIANLSVATGAIGSGEPVDLKIALDVQVGEPAIDSHVSIEGVLDYDAAEKSLLVDKLQLQVEDLKLGGRIRISHLDTAPVTDGTISVAEFNAKKLLESLSMEVPQTSDPDALTRVSLESAIRAGSNQLALNPLTIRIDDSTLSGEVSLPDLKSQAVRFDLAVDAIDVDRYLAPEKEKSGNGAAAPVAATPGAGAGAAVATELPNEALRKLDAIGRMKIGKLKVAKLNLTAVDMSVKAKNGLIKLNPLDANLYSGTYRGNIVVDARGKTPRLTVDENLRGVLAGPLLEDLKGYDPITGATDVNVALQTMGASADEVKKSLNGSADFAFTKGAINGVNIARMIREAYARIKGTKLPAEEVEQKTDFSELRGSLHIVNGIATNDDFIAMTPLLRINGKGTANLPAETLDYRVQATVVTTLKGEGGEELKDLVGIPIPIHVTGSFADPRYALDTQALAEALAKSKLKDVLENKVGDDTVRGLLKGLLK
jgi:AsmA protein